MNTFQKRSIGEDEKDRGDGARTAAFNLREDFILARGSGAWPALVSAHDKLQDSQQTGAIAGARRQKKVPPRPLNIPRGKSTSR